MVDIIYRTGAGGRLRNLEEGDQNLRNISDAIEDRAPYKRDVSGNPIGYQGPYGAVYPVILRPMEILAGSAVAAPSQFTGFDEVLSSVIIPGGVLGPNSILQIEPVWSFTSGANNKILKIRIGGTVLFTATRTTSAAEAPLIVLANRNAINTQLIPYSGGPGYYSAAAAAPATAAIDFSVNKSVEFIGQRANAGDALTLEYFRILHFLSD